MKPRQAGVRTALAGLPLLLMLVPALVPRAVPAQQVEAVIRLSDSSYPSLLLMNPVDDRLYCTSDMDHQLYIVDGTSYEIKGRIPGANYYSALVWNAVDDRLYWSNGNRCYVLDCPTGTVIDSLQDDGLGECVLAWNPSDDRLYAGCNNYDSTLLVYDAATNQLLTLIPDVWNVTAMVWDSVNHKLYATNVNGWLYVIDGATNTVDTVVHSVGYGQAWRLTCNPVNSRLYVEDRDDWPVSINLTTFDYNDLGGGPKGVVAWLPEQDRLYAAGFEGIARFDCEAETLVKQVLATYWHGQLLWNPRSNRLYLAPDENLDLVIADCAADSVITTLDAGDYAQGIAWNPNNNRVFITNSRDGTITVVADSSTAVTESGQRDQSQTPALFAIGGVLQLPPEPEVREMCLLDASGRRCARLHSGSNDVSRLAAGVYFLRRRGASTDSCTRVIVN